MDQTKGEMSDGKMEQCKSRVETSFGELIINDAIQSRSEAQEHCRSLGASLPVLQHASTIREIETHLSDCVDERGALLRRSATSWRVALTTHGTEDSLVGRWSDTVKYDPYIHRQLLDERHLPYDARCHDGFLMSVGKIRMFECDLRSPFLCMRRAAGPGDDHVTVHGDRALSGSLSSSVAGFPNWSYFILFLVVLLALLLAVAALSLLTVRMLRRRRRSGDDELDAEVNDVESKTTGACSLRDDSMLTATPPPSPFPKGTS